MAGSAGVRIELAVRAVGARLFQTYCCAMISVWLRKRVWDWYDPQSKMGRTLQVLTYDGIGVASPESLPLHPVPFLPKIVSAPIE